MQSPKLNCDESVQGTCWTGILQAIPRQNKQPVDEKSTCPAADAWLLITLQRTIDGQSPCYDVTKLIKSPPTTATRPSIIPDDRIVRWNYYFWILILRVECSDRKQVQCDDCCPWHLECGPSHGPALEKAAGGGTCGTLIPGISLHAPDLEIGFFWWGQPEAGSPTGRLSSLLTRMTHSLRGARPASKTKEPVDIKHLKEFVNYSRSRARKTHPAASKFSRPTFLHFRNFKTDAGENEWAWPWSTTSDTKTIKSHNI